MALLGCQWTNFNDIHFLRIFRIFVEKIEVWLNADMDNRYFAWKHMYVYNNMSLNSSQNEKRFRQKLWRQWKHTLCVKRIVVENRAVYEILWKRMVKQTGHRWQYNTAHACYMLDNKGYRHTLRICNTYCFSVATMVMQTRLNIKL